MIEERLNTAALRALLRVFSLQAPAGLPTIGSTLTVDDLEPLSLWWALSPGVERLARRVLEHPREVQPYFRAEEQELFGLITGSIQASATITAQAVTADPTRFAVVDDVRSFISGPNRVIAVTLDSARRILVSAARTDSTLEGLVDRRFREISAALRVYGLRDVLFTPDGRRPVTSHERRETARVRSVLYRLANEAATHFQRLQELDASAVQSLFSEALLPSLEPWRRFELACLIHGASGISRATGERVHLNLRFAGAGPTATVGEFELHWQFSIRPRRQAKLDEGESMSRLLHESLGVKQSTRRSDIAVLRGGVLVALIECKWFTNAQQAPNAIVEACHQLVAYARDHTAVYGGQPREILARSIVALGLRGDAPRILSGAPICCLDFEDLEQDVFDDWAAGATGGAKLSAT